MARARRTTTTAKASKATGGDSLICPECGKTFTRAASLGAHRNRAHGVSGASKRRTRSTPVRRRTTRTRRRANASTGAGNVNRDALLQALFPNGLPAREEVIRRANAWLDEAEQLAQSK